MTRGPRRGGTAAEQLSLDGLSLRSGPDDLADAEGRGGRDDGRGGPRPGSGPELQVLRSSVPGQRHRWSAVDIAAALQRPTPTAEQVAVIEAPVEPLLVVAGAGSGKTETMAARVVWLVANGFVLPEQVLGLTFTRKAAGELAERVRARLRALHRRNLIGEPAPVTVATYHSYAAGVLGDHGLRLGLEPTATLLGEAGAWQLADEIVGAWDGDMSDVDSARSTVVDAVLTLAGECAEHLVEPDEVAAWLDALVEHVTELPAAVGDATPGKPVTAVAKLLKEKLLPRRRLVPLLQEYAARKRSREVLDFGDQVALAARLARDVPDVAASERRRFPVVLLDEYQDTSHAQLVLLRSLFGDGHPVTAVGDPHQSIYGWRGASAGNLERFPEHFPAASGAPARVAHLSTSWRNDEAVLDVANLLAGPLRRPPSWLRERPAPVVSVQPLTARPGAGPGRVRVDWHDTVDDEVRAVADLAERAWAATPRRSVAVLCRTRSQFPAVEAQLRGRGLPVEVVGLGGLLHQPEVAELRAALEVVHDPSRGDSLMRLLTGAAWRIGAADLQALAVWASQQAARHRRRAEATTPDEPGEQLFGGGPAEAATGEAEGAGASGEAGGDAAEPVELDAVDERSLVEAVDELPGELWQGPDGQTLSDEGRRRLRRLGDVLRGLRARTLLPLPDLVVEAERALLIDVEVASRPGVSPALARVSLDAFVEVAVGFAATADSRRGGGFGSSGLGAFLGWLQAAQERERGLDSGTPGAAGEAVQVLTVHAAKGLEWDVVAVPGLTEGCFPSGPGGRALTASKGWVADLGALPYELRGDVDGLPRWAWSNAASQADLGTRWEEFVQGCTDHDVAEERRLAYVAVTRARHEALLSGAVWGEGKSPRLPSRFLLEVREHAEAQAEDSAGAASRSQEAPGLAVGTWADPPGEGAQNPRLQVGGGLTWPIDPLAARRGGVEDGAARVRRALAEASVPDAAPAAAVRAEAAAADTEVPAGEREAAWAAEVEALLAERDAGRQARLDVELPAHLSASQLVALARDAGSLAARLRRPMPVPPSPAARRGSAFHAWLERRFASAALLDVDELPGAADDAEPAPAAEEDLPALQAAFLAGPWAARLPEAVEVAIETPVGPVVVRGRIDAVFAEPPDDAGRPCWTVVDWKTGPPPVGQAQEEAAAVQLAVYRLAWARLQGVDVAQVGAAFCYVAAGLTVRPVDLLDESGLVAVVTRALAGPDSGGVSALPQRRRRG